MLRVTGLVLKLVARALWISTMVLTPLFGFWLASSLAAYQNATQWLSLLVGLLLFPLIPVGWDAVFVWRRRDRPPAKAILTRLDRLVLRTLLVNGAFLAVMLLWQPRTAFRSLAVRGDWIVDGHDGPIASTIRGGLLGLADTFERRWHQGSGYGTSDKAPEPTAPVVATQPPEWPLPAAIDIQVSDMPESVQGSPQAVGIYLSARITDPKRLAKAVHDYIALRLQYDYPAYEGKKERPPQDGASVFAAREGVCEGYARLFVEIGRAAKLEVAYLTGFARDSQLIPPAAGTELQALEGYGHAWNAVKLDGSWHLVDVTWDDPKDPARPIETWYFLTPPAAFGNQHLPDDSAWQLVETPITPGEFVRRPLLTPPPRLMASRSSSRRARRSASTASSPCSSRIHAAPRSSDRSRGPALRTRATASTARRAARSSRARCRRASTRCSCSRRPRARTSTTTSARSRSILASRSRRDRRRTPWPRCRRAGAPRWCSRCSSAPRRSCGP